MPFGKYKGTPIADLPYTYKAWLLDQDGFADKHPQLADCFRGRDVSTPKENENLAIEAQLLLSMSEPFKRWWLRAYGERLRKQGEFMYIPYLRVAIAAWTEASLQLGEQFLKPVGPAGDVSKSDEQINF